MEKRAVETNPDVIPDERKR